MANKKVEKQSMFDKFEIKGYWWLPNSDEKVAGILFYQHDSIKLELIGLLGSNNIENHFSNQSENVSIILGYSDKGEEFTLLDSFQSNFNINSPGYMTETYTINSFIVGAHFNTQEEISFHSMVIYPTYFSKWVAKSPFNREYILKDGIISTIGSIKFNEPTMFKINVESINAKIEETYSSNLSADIHQEINWNYKSGFKVIPNEWQNLEWFRKNMFDLRDLYTLFIGYPTYFNNVILYGNEQMVGSQTTRLKYYLFTIQKDVKIRDKFNWNDAMIKYRDIHDNLSDIFNSWFEKQDVLKTVVDLYLGDFYKETYLETKFLNAVQTLEIYHRKLHGGKLMDESDYEKYSLQLSEYTISNFPPEFANKITGMLIHGNEYSLSKRFREIINSLNKETKTYLIGNSDARGKFIQQLVDTRNYLTHYDVGNKKNVLKDSGELFYSVQRLKALATLILYKEIGVNEELVLKNIQESKQFAYSITEAKRLLN